MIYHFEAFSFENVDYEVRVVQDGENYRIAAFRDGSRANGFEYTVSLMMNYDLKKVIGTSGVRHFIDEAIADVRKKRWEEVLDAVAKLKDDQKKAGI